MKNRPNNGDTNSDSKDHDNILVYQKDRNTSPENNTYRQIEFRLKESEKISRALLENSPVCTKIIDIDLNLQYMSDAGVKALKLHDVSQYYGKPYPLSFYSESFKEPMLDSIIEAKSKGEVIKNEAPILDSDGKEIWFYSTIVPVKLENGSIDYFLIVSVDITKRVEALEALKVYQNNLENIVETRTIELEEKNHDLEKYNNLFQGREFRIKELRDQVKELKEKLKRYENNRSK